MLTRRGFAGLTSSAICGTTNFIATDAFAQGAHPAAFGAGVDASGEVGLTNQSVFNVTDYGADPTGVADSSAAFQAAINDAIQNRPNSHNFSTVFVPTGEYLIHGISWPSSPGILLQGAGQGLTTLIHANGYCEPIIYITSDQGYIPFGGVTKLSLQAGTNTFAHLYTDGTPDQQWLWDELTVQGKSYQTIASDGFSFHDCINNGARKHRMDGIGGWWFKIRGQSAGFSKSSRYRLNNPSTIDGSWRYGPATTPHIGTPVMLWSEGSLPAGFSDGSAGAIYYVAKGSCPDSNLESPGYLYLSHTRAHALAGTNIIVPSTTGSGDLLAVVCPAWFTVSSVDTTNNTIAFTNDKGVILRTSKVASGHNITTGLGGTAITSSNSTNFLLLTSTGSLPSPLVVGTPYYPIYVDAQTIKLASSPANAAAGAAIDLTTTGGGIITILYNDDITTPAGAGHFNISDFTCDNLGGRVSSYIDPGGRNIPCGGYGIFFADYSQQSGLGISISFESGELEHNVPWGIDPNMNYPFRQFFRIVNDYLSYTGDYGSSHPGITTCNICLRQLNITGDVAAFHYNYSGSDVFLIGCRDGDAAPTLQDVKYSCLGGISQNDWLTAYGAQRVSGKWGRGYVIDSHGRYFGVSAAIDGTKIGGKSVSVVSAAQLGNAFANTGDILIADDSSPAIYKAVQATNGACSGGNATTGVSCTGTVPKNRFAFTGSPTDQFVSGTSIVIPGAGTSGTDLTGIVGIIDSSSNTKSFTLVDVNGRPVDCATAVSGVTPTFAVATFAQIDSYLVASATLNFGTIAAAGYSDLSLSVPGAAVDRLVQVSVPGNTPAGVLYQAFVATAGTVTVRATNVQGLITVPSGTFTVRVKV